MDLKKSGTTNQRILDTINMIKNYSSKEKRAQRQKGNIRNNLNNSDYLYIQQKPQVT